MAHKAFYVTRTEDPVTHTAGAATLNRADNPQLVKVFDSADDIVLSSLVTDEVVGTKESDFEAIAIVDRVAADNMNPITSNAVATELHNYIRHPISILDKVTLTNTNHNYYPVKCMYYEDETNWFVDFAYIHPDGSDYNTLITIDLSDIIGDNYTYTNVGWVMRGGSGDIGRDTPSLTNKILTHNTDTNTGYNNKAYWLELVYRGTKA